MTNINDVKKCRIYAWEFWDRFLNRIWFLFNRTRYRKFVERCKRENYNYECIWYNRKIGFFAWPEDETTVRKFGRRRFYDIAGELKEAGNEDNV